MTNLLPEKERSVISWDMLHRMLLSSSLLLLGAGVVTLLALAPGLLFFVMGVSGAQVTAASSGKSADTSAIAQTQALVSQVAPAIATTTSPTRAIVAALSLKESGVTIDHITYSADNPSSLIMSGSASVKDSVNSYRAVLAADGRFLSVTVPVSALVGADSGKFTITLTGKF